MPAITLGSNGYAEPVYSWEPPLIFGSYWHQFDLKKRSTRVGFKNMQDALPTIMAYITIVICISTVDNITNSVLLFLMLILRYGTLNEDSLVSRVT